LANRFATRFGIWKASVKAEKAPLVPNRAATTISRATPTMRETPVAIEKIAVLRATLPVPPGVEPPARPVSLSAMAGKAAIVRRSAARQSRIFVRAEAF
jgi:hypothetical protein